MKIRTGFVSNSSSSSYVILSNKPFTVERILEKINIDKNHILYDIAQNIAGTYSDIFDKWDDSYSFDDEYYTTFEEFCDCFGISKDIIALANEKNYQYYVGKLDWYSEDEGYGETVIEQAGLTDKLFKKIGEDIYLFE